MFTGLITDVGTVLSLKHEGDLKVRVGTNYDPGTIALGASIACDGVCLTVIERGIDPATGGWFDVQASAETLSSSTLGLWSEGSRVNLERALKVGDELGGHIVSGHVDGVGAIVAMVDEGDSTRFSFEAPEDLARYIAPKGSITLNGTSLTVNEVDGARFGVNIIPHTKSVTNWGGAAEGDPVNIEIDTLARYVARLREWSDG